MLYYCYRISQSIFGYTGFRVSKLLMKKWRKKSSKSGFLKIFRKLILDISRNCSCEEKIQEAFSSFAKLWFFNKKNILAQSSKCQSIWVYFDPIKT